MVTPLQEVLCLVGLGVRCDDDLCDAAFMSVVVVVVCWIPACESVYLVCFDLFYG